MREAVQLAEMAAAIKGAFDKKELPALRPGRDVPHDVEARCLSDRDGRWHPHLMFFLPLAEPTECGAGEESAEGGATGSDTERHTDSKGLMLRFSCASGF